MGRRFRKLCRDPGKVLRLERGVLTTPCEVNHPQILVLVAEVTTMALIAVVAQHAPGFVS